MIAFIRLVRRDLVLALRHGADAATAVLFFVLCVVLFPFGLGPEPNLLARIAPGLILVAALLASLLALERLFLADHEDGSLELLALGPWPLELLALAKILAHWLLTGLPLILAAPLLALLLNLPVAALPVLLTSLALVTPVLSLIGAVGAALTLGTRRGGVLMPLLILPLYIPALIFASAAVEAGLTGLPATPHLLLLAGILAGALSLAPWAVAAGLRAALD
jgi:heme exporter protein B